MKTTPAPLLRKLLYLLLALTLLGALFSQGTSKAALMLALGILLVVAGLMQMLMVLFKRKD